ncbi:MAG: transcription antitermination factor NusB [Planctomycetota bacterium]
MSTRRRAREIVLQLLYEADLNDWRDEESSRRFIRSRLQGRKVLTQFASDLREGTLKQQGEIDEHLSRLSNRWALSRMPVTDRNVLRLGAYEILFTETPGQVAISEALTLARRYGGKDSPRFINGVLDKLFKTTANEAS